MTDQPTADDSLDDLYDTLSNSRRRFVLHYLHDRGDRIPVGRLAARLGSLEGGTAATVTDRVELSLRHIHLPKLHSVGLVVYDHDRGVVEAPPSSERIHRSIRRAERFHGTHENGDGTA